MDTFLRLYRFYLATFTAVAAFGLLQFGLGLLGVDLLVRQWWFPGLPRINGFSYEPSYFGTYLIIGWIQIFMLSLAPQPVLPRSTLRRMLILISLVLVLSSSRMSILVMVLFVAVNGANQGLLLLTKLRISRAWMFILVFATCTLAAATIFVLSHWETVEFLFAGLGIRGGATHSSGARLDSLQETLDVFLRSPFIGVSLGGVAPGIAEGRGILVDSNEAAKIYEGINIFAEMLAASGTVGFPFFLAYMFTLFYAPWRRLRAIRVRDPGLSRLLAVMLVALLFELIILSMNQNILRPFLWIHIGMISLAYKLAAEGDPGAGIGGAEMRMA